MCVGPPMQQNLSTIPSPIQHDSQIAVHTE